MSLLTHPEGNVDGHTYERVALNECEEDRRKKIIDYWQPRNSADLSKISILCPDTEKLILLGDETLSKFQAIQIDFEYCFESRPAEECETADFITSQTDAGLIQWLVELEYKQLNMKNFTTALQNTVSMFPMKLQSATRE